MLRWPNRQRYVEAFRGQITRWEQYTVFGFLIDRVGRYQNAGHAFFADYRPNNYREGAAFELWPLIVSFLKEHLAL
ncbi:MAG: dienelactone hydrolase family protein [Chloroflexota bacterium]|nr:dienelactone hydrolase family protein [Chloroflexota bacterium]